MRSLRVDMFIPVIFIFFLNSEETSGESTLIGHNLKERIPSSLAPGIWHCLSGIP